MTRASSIRLPFALARTRRMMAWSADEFVSRVITAAPAQIADIVEQQAADLKNPPCNVEKLLQKLEKQGLTRSVPMLIQLFAWQESKSHVRGET